MPHPLTNAERWRLRAEEYRAIADSMRDENHDHLIARPFGACARLPGSAGFWPCSLQRRMQADGAV
jgi:hypothetical protein